MAIEIHPENDIIPTGTEARVVEDIARRQQRGIAKYGTTVADNPLAVRDWLQHFYEELLDAAVYAKRAIDEINAAQTMQRISQVEQHAAAVELLSRMDVLAHEQPELTANLQRMRTLVRIISGGGQS